VTPHGPLRWPRVAVDNERLPARWPGPFTIHLARQRMARIAREVLASMIPSRRALASAFDPVTNRGLDHF
jgi:hypothetical protein